MKSAQKLFKTGAAALVLSTGLTSNALAITHTIDFDLAGMTHGTVIDNQYQSIGVTISAVNQASGNRYGHYAVAYDSAPGINTGEGKLNDKDPDLTGPSWGNGNIASNNLNLGNVLIIQETKYHQTAGCADGTCAKPDDEGDRTPAAGDLIFDFSTAITEFGMDLIDVEGPSEYCNQDSGYVAAFFDSAGTELGSMGFHEFIARDSAVYGNNSVNRISPIDFANDLNITSDVMRVVVDFGGSAALDNVVFSTESVSVSEPGTVSLFSLGALMLWMRRRTTAK